MTEPGWQATEIEGVLLRHSVTIEDDRGSFMEVWRSSQTDPFGEPMVQLNLSRSRRGVLRGMHFHLRQADVMIVIEGRALAATTDVRGFMNGSHDRAISQIVELAPGDALYVPRLVAHGFWATEDLELLYLVSNAYDATDELGFAWDDAFAGLTWPSDDPIVSERDLHNPSLADVAARLRQSNLAD